MARIAERLILLNNVSQGLMARVHHLLSFKRPAVLDSQLDKVCQKFVKKFPDFQANAIEKGPAYNLFKQHATEVHSSLYAYYYTLVDVAHIKDESLKLLNDVASDMLDLTFDVMRDLTIWFMELLTNIVQLLLLVDRLDDRKEFTIIFAYSFYFTQSTYEPNYQKVSKFLIDCSSPIRQLQDDCEQISHRVIHTLLALSPRFVEHSQLTVIRDKGYLNLCDAPDQLSKSACADLYFELQNIERFRKWILYGFLVVPSALEKDEVRDVIRLALQFGLVVPIYRDQLINIHELYGGLFTSPNFKKLKLSKSKEIAKSAYAYALNDSVAEHADSRRFLRATISVFCSLLNAAPELLTPKFPVLLAAISLCRQEISWYFSHLSARNPMQKDWSKWSQLEGFDDEYIGELLFHVNSLTTLVSTRSDIIRDYYLSYLRNGVEVLIGLADELKKDTRLSNYSSNLLQAVVDFDSNSSSSESFEAFVMNCHRLSAQLMSAQAGSRNPATRALIVHLNSVIFRAQCVSLLPNLVKTYGSLSQLYFFGGELKEAFAQCLRSRGHIPRYCLSFIFIYAEAKHNLHQCCPEENVLIATESVRLAEEGLTEISNAIANCLRTLSTSFLQLASEGNIAGNRPNPESHPFDEAYRSIEYSRQLCSNLCTAFRECQTIQVFDQQLCPGQYLVQSIRTCAKDVLRAAASSSGNVEIPSKFRFKSKIIFRAIQEIQSHIDIGTESLFREVLSEEMPASKKRNSDPIAPGQSNHIQK